MASTILTWCIFACLLSNAYGIIILTAPSAMVANQPYTINWTNNEDNFPFVLQRKSAGVQLDPSAIIGVPDSDKLEGTVIAFFYFVGEDHQFLALKASDRSTILGQSNNISVVPDDGSSSAIADNQVSPSTTNFSVAPSATRVEPEDSSQQSASATLMATTSMISSPTSSSQTPRTAPDRTAVIIGTTLGLLVLLMILAIVLFAIRYKRVMGLKRWGQETNITPYYHPTVHRRTYDPESNARKVNVRARAMETLLAALRLADAEHDESQIVIHERRDACRLESMIPPPSYRSDEDRPASLRAAGKYQ